MTNCFVKWDSSLAQFTPADQFLLLHCRPRIEEIPELNKFARENGEVAVVAITFDTVGTGLSQWNIDSQENRLAHQKPG